MLEIRSTGCGKFHHAEFRLRFDDHAAIERDARELVASLERQVGAGHPIRDGDSFRYGWLDLHFALVEQGLLAVQEPDFRTWPIRYTDSVTHSLCHLRWQKECAASLGIDVPATTPAMAQTAAICPRLEHGRGAFFMERHDASPSNSGWIIGCAEPAHDHAHDSAMVRASLYEIVARFQVPIAAFLGLPPGTKVLNTSYGLWIACDGRSHQIRRGSFLDRVVKGTGHGRAASVLVDEAHNLLQWPPGKEIPAYLIPAARSLMVKCRSRITAPPEIQAVGLREPNIAMLLSKQCHWQKVWNPLEGVEFDLAAPSADCQARSDLTPGDELILVIGYRDPGPDSRTQGGIAAMWSGRLRVMK